MIDLDFKSKFVSWALYAQTRRIHPKLFSSTMTVGQQALWLMIMH